MRREALLAQAFSAYTGWFDEARERLGTPQVTQALKETLADMANVEKLSTLLENGISRADCGRLFSSWAKVMLYAGPPSRLLPVMETALAYLRKTNRNFRWVGRLHYRARSLVATLRKREPPPRDEPLAQVLEALGDVYARMGKAREAGRAYHEARWRYRSVEDSLGVAQVEKALGHLHQGAGRFREAEAAFLQALRLYPTHDKHPGEAETYMALGDLYLREERQQDANASYKKARESFQENGWPLGEAHSSLVLGRLQSRLSHSLEAEKAYEEALRLYRQLEWHPGVAEVCKALGDLHLARDNWEKAEIHYREALQTDLPPSEGFFGQDFEREITLFRCCL